MKIQFLSNFDLADIHPVFLRAFSDYLVPMNLTRDQFAELLKRRAARNDISVAAFENGVPVGFTLNALEPYQSVLTAYDVVTGIAPEARRKGIARKLFDFSLPRLTELHASRYVLEVFENNQPAVRLYEGVGFQILRKLEVYTLAGNKTMDVARQNYECREVAADWKTFQSFWDWHPSWQNSISSLGRIEYKSLGLFQNEKLIGYGIVLPETGDIPQFAIAPQYRKNGAGASLLHHLLTAIRSDRTPRVVNVDGSAKETIRFLLKNGFILFGRQNEMELIL
jgi:ribosomal protein S18 acetylase RimI-like enzyme